MTYDTKMQKAEHIVTHKTNDLPQNLKSAAEIARDGLTEERIIELADAGYLPHYRIDGGPPVFKVSEVKEWIANNLTTRCVGRGLPDSIRVVLHAHPVSEKPPRSIWNLPGLQQLPKYGYTPGVYFLCKADQVVYVGQSITPSTRIGQHTRDEGKDFDRVYLFPCPASELNNVEAAFIKLLMPAQQGGIRSGRHKPITPSTERSTEETLNYIGVRYTEEQLE